MISTVFQRCYLVNLRAFYDLHTGSIWLITPWAIIYKFFSLSLSYCLINYYSIELFNPFGYKTADLRGLHKMYCDCMDSLTSLSRLQGCVFCRFSIDRHTDLERQFNINAEDGKITLATPLDRETNMWHNITIVATETSKYLYILKFGWFYCHYF